MRDFADVEVTHPHPAVFLPGKGSVLVRVVLLQAAYSRLVVLHDLSRVKKIEPPSSPANR